MQFSAVLNMFIVKTYLNSIFTNDLKRKYFFRKMFIVTDLVSLRKEFALSGSKFFPFRDVPILKRIAIEDSVGSL